MKDPTLLDYYARRAEQYEQIYQKPERQAKLALLKAYLVKLLAGRDVLEVACGTGYWTAHLAPFTRSILATDAADEVLDVARAKTYPPRRTVRTGRRLHAEGPHRRLHSGLCRLLVVARAESASSWFSEHLSRQIATGRAGGFCG